MKQLNLRKLDYDTNTKNCNSGELSGPKASCLFQQLSLFFLKLVITISYCILGR